MTTRVTRHNVDSCAETLCEVLGLPAKFRDPGNIFVQGQNGYYTIQQIVSDSGGVTTLATGLKLREAHEWLCAAIRGACMQRDGFKPFN